MMFLKGLESDDINVEYQRGSKKQLRPFTFSNFALVIKYIKSKYQWENVMSDCCYVYIDNSMIPCYYLTTNATLLTRCMHKLRQFNRKTNTFYIYTKHVYPHALTFP